MKPLVDAVPREVARRPPKGKRRCHSSQVRSGCRLNSCGIVTEIHTSRHILALEVATRCEDA